MNLIFTEIKTTDGKENNYYFGLDTDEYMGYKAYGHSGFWGTVVYHFPALNTSVSIFILERDQRKLRPDIMDQIIGILTR
ncbi:MAG: hypothetical protein R2764_04770 [Bacteroidales bacterium]